MVNEVKTVETESKSLPERVINKKNRIPMFKRKRMKEVAFSDEKMYHHYTFTDKNGNIERALESGYKFINAPAGKEHLNAQEPSRFGKVICQSVGNGEVGYTMRIPREWYESDRAAKQKVLDQKDKDMGRDLLPSEALHCFRGKVKVDNSNVK